MIKRFVELDDLQTAVQQLMRDMLLKCQYAIPAVEPSMSAVEYLKARVRMENWSNAMCGETACDACPSCDECPYDPELVPSDTDEEENPEKAVAIVEAWAKEHMKERSEEGSKTYAEDFEEHFGHSWNSKENNWQCREKLYNDSAECIDSPRCDCEACWNQKKGNE